MPERSSHDSLVTIAEAARILRCSPRTVARLQEDGLLEPIYQGSLRNPQARRFYSRAQVVGLTGAQAAS